MELKWINFRNNYKWEEKTNQVLSNIHRESPCCNPIINELRENHNFSYIYPLLVHKETGDVLELTILGNLKVIHIDFIGVTMRKKGRGSYIMRILTQLSDKYQYSLQLEISSKFGMKKRVLKKFYKKFGFIERSGMVNSYLRKPLRINNSV